MILLSLAVAAAAAVAPTSARGPDRPALFPASGRQGGDDAASAFVIPGLAFLDTGTTCGYADDYLADCEKDGRVSTAPDVVYSFTPEADVHVSISLEGSDYDTVLKVLDHLLVPVACNDDWYDLTSYLPDVALAGGETYYIVVDGCGDECGHYRLSVETYTPPEPCELTWATDVVDEGEPPISDGYVDNYNGGCNSDPFVIQTIDWVNSVDDGYAVLHGVEGGYSFEGSDYRDTDWFDVTVGESGDMEHGVRRRGPVALRHVRSRPRLRVHHRAVPGQRRSLRTDHALLDRHSRRALLALRRRGRVRHRGRPGGGLRPEGARPRLHDRCRRADELGRGQDHVPLTPVAGRPEERRPGRQAPGPRAFLRESGDYAPVASATIFCSRASRFS